MTTGPRLVSRHEGHWQACVTCGVAENAHRYRHPFTTMWPARVTPPKHRARSLDKESPIQGSEV